MISLTVLSERPVLGSFEKAIEGSRSLNFGISGGRNCDRRCIHHPDSVAEQATFACYAVRTEIRPQRRGLKKKLQRHEAAGAHKIAIRALEELKDAVVSGQGCPWLRISTNGSVPQPNQASESFLRALNELLEFCLLADIPVHFPVETADKARFYRQKVGYRAVVRESAQSLNRFLTAPGAVSFVGGDPAMSRIERVAAAKLIASMRTRRTNRKTIVCPAVADMYLHGTPHAESKSKCGNCVACANGGTDIIYPLH
jgi:hypothetical protein